MEKYFLLMYTKSKDSSLHKIFARNMRGNIRIVLKNM